MMNTNTYTISDVITYLQQEVPLSLQESYDNCGLQVGDQTRPLTGILLAVDISIEVIEEAIERGCNLIVNHHPMLFHGLKQITGRTYIERAVQLAIKNDIAIYAAHTNLDNSPIGVNHFFAQLLHLQNTRVLDPIDQLLYKVVTYVPTENASQVRERLLQIGVGAQGAYDGCSFTVSGEGRFRALEGADPYVGSLGEWHCEPEEAIYTMCHRHQLSLLLRELKSVHPYEEPVIDVFSLKGEDPNTGGGIIGTLPTALSVKELFAQLRELMPIQVLAHSKVLKDPISKVAFCGGSGAFMRRKAAALGADIFITGEAKYNDYYDAIDDVTLVTIGHYESEELTKRLFHSILCRKFPKFAIYYSSMCKNPINYIF